MAFAQYLCDALDEHESKLDQHFAAGLDLRGFLTRQLLAVEEAADTELITSILLLDDGGTRLWHGAGPRLPQAYCDAIDGAHIGPAAGSCGTAAFLGRAIYVSDIANDALWADYRDIALEHGFRACWSTPIFHDDGRVLATFAIYHFAPRSPTREEVSAIWAIGSRVARAIMHWQQPGRPYRSGSQDGRDWNSDLVSIRRSTVADLAVLMSLINGAAASTRNLVSGADRENMEARLQALVDEWKRVLATIQAFRGGTR